MTPAAIKRAMDIKMRVLVKKAHRMEDEAVKKIIRNLNQTRKEIISQVATTPWQTYRLKELQQAVELSMTEFADQYKIDMAGIQQGFYAHGIKYEDVPLKAIGIDIPGLLAKKNILTQIDPNVLAIMQDYTPDLITGMSKDGIAKINGALSRGLLGQKTAYETMVEVGRNLKDKSVFSSIAKRAEVITRTESSRVLQAASHARGMEAAKVVPGLGKEWRHDTYGPNPRPGHQEANGQQRREEEYFNVAPEVGGYRESLMYPKDFRGSAANTINCDCWKIPWHPNWNNAIETANKETVESGAALPEGNKTIKETQKAKIKPVKGQKVKKPKV